MSGVFSGAYASRAFSLVLLASSVLISAFMLSWIMPDLIASMMSRIRARIGKMTLFRLIIENRVLNIEVLAFFLAPSFGLCWRGGPKRAGPVEGVLCRAGPEYGLADPNDISTFLDGCLEVA